MKIIVTGSHWDVYYAHVDEAIRASGWEHRITEIVSGGAPGADRGGEIWAIRHHLPRTVLMPDWERDGRRARAIGYVRMTEYADAAIAIWDGCHRGTRSLMRLAQRRGLPIFVYRVEPPSPEELDASGSFAAAWSEM